MIPRHDKLLQYNCKEYLIDIHELICVNKILKYFAGHHSDENQRRLNIISRISIVYVPKHEQNFHKSPTILKTFCKNARHGNPWRGVPDKIPE